MGQHSIRINDQWRVCFVWLRTDAEEVEIVENLQAHYSLVETRLARAETYQAIKPRRGLEVAA